MSTKTTAHRFSSILTMLLAISLLFGSLTLVGCGSKTEEQDNCYGEDMPVINEE